MSRHKSPFAPLSRRSFLTGAAATAAAIAARPLPLFGQGQGGSSGSGFKILEVFLQGGLSHQETFWCPTPTTAEGYYRPNYLAAGVDLPLPLLRLRLGDAHYLDSCTRPLTPSWGETRIVAVGHDQGAHEAGVPLALSGLSLGRPNRAGHGAAVEWADEEALTPLSYIVHAEKGRVSAGHAGAYGLLGPANIPITVGLNENMSMGDFAGDFAGRRHEASDELLQVYSDQFGTTRGDFRSRGHDAHHAAASKLRTEGLQQVLREANLAAGSYYGYQGSTAPSAGAPNATRSQLDVAASLLAGDARYVCVVDSGVDRDYDHHPRGETHGSILSAEHTGNVWSLCDHLQHLIDSRDIDLTDTLVVLNTEFGRKPYKNGTDHHAPGYAVVLLGGPVLGNVSQPAVTGNIDSGGTAQGPDNTVALTPTDLRQALLLAAGVVDPDPEDVDPDTGDVDPVNDIFGLEGSVLDNSVLATAFFGQPL